MLAEPASDALTAISAAKPDEKKEEGNDSASESLNITLNSNQTFQALFELVVDSDGDGVTDSEDYLPFNPYKTYDDWGEFKDEYADVFYS